MIQSTHTKMRNLTPWQAQEHPIHKNRGQTKELTTKECRLVEFIFN